jgi:hypothetical protein
MSCTAAPMDVLVYACGYMYADHKRRSHNVSAGMRKQVQVAVVQLHCCT